MNFNNLDFAHRRRSTLLKLVPRKVLQVYVVGLGSTRVKYARPSFYIQSHQKTLVLAYFERNKCTLFYDLTRDSIANNFVTDVCCRCLQIVYQIAFFYKI